jgi:hypothetical protein
MVRPKIIPDWEPDVYALLAKDERQSAVKLADALEDIAARRGAIPPSPRTVRRIKKLWDGLTEDQRRLYREVHWPETFQSGALPWEAAPLTLEIMNGLEELEPNIRPLVRNVLWAWRIKQAKPDAPAWDCWEAARSLAWWEQSPDDNKHVPGAIEAWLRGRGDLQIAFYSSKGDEDMYRMLETVRGAPFRKKETDGTQS